MKRLSERLSERLAQRDMSRLALEPARPATTQPIGRNLETSVTCHDSKLRFCPSCETHKPYKMPYWELGKRKCRHCDKWSRFGR